MLLNCVCVLVFRASAFAEKSLERPESLLIIWNSLFHSAINFEINIPLLQVMIV